MYSNLLQTLTWTRDQVYYLPSPPSQSSNAGLLPAHHIHYSPPQDEPLDLTTSSSKVIMKENDCSGDYIDMKTDSAGTESGDSSSSNVEPDLGKKESLNYNSCDWL